MVSTPRFTFSITEGWGGGGGQGDGQTVIQGADAYNERHTKSGAGGEGGGRGGAE